MEHQEKDRYPHLKQVHSHAYTLNVVCHGQGQDYIRAMLLQEIHGGDLRLKKLESKSSGSDQAVEISMDLVAAEISESAIERMIAHLILQPSVVSARWSALADA